MAAANPNPKNKKNSNKFTIVESNNALPALDLKIEKLIPRLKQRLPTITPFNLVKAFSGLISNKSVPNSDIEYLVPYSEISSKAKESDTQNTKLMKLFSSYPTKIVYYFINVYLSVFNGNVRDSTFHQLLANIQVPGLIDEQKYTAYNQVSPMDTYNEMFGNDLLVNHLRCFFGIQPCFPEFENARERDLFIGFIKCGPIIRGIKGFFAKLTKKFSNIGGHMNSFIIDKTKKLIFHFEPKGSGSSVYQPFNLKQFICRVAGEKYNSKSHTININGVEYTFVDTKDLTMVQTPLLNFDIFCQTYSILAILIYLLNIENIHALPREIEIMNIFPTISKEDALKFRNFFNKICFDNFIQIIEYQENQILRGIEPRTPANIQFENNSEFEMVPVSDFGHENVVMEMRPVVPISAPKEIKISENKNALNREKSSVSGGYRISKKQNPKSKKQTKKIHRKRTHKSRKTT